MSRVLPSASPGDHELVESEGLETGAPFAVPQIPMNLRDLVETWGNMMAYGSPNVGLSQSLVPLGSAHQALLGGMLRWPEPAEFRAFGKSGVAHTQPGAVYGEPQVLQLHHRCLS